MVGATAVWFVIERAGYNLPSVLSNALLLLVSILFFWAKSASLLNSRQARRRSPAVINSSDDSLNHELISDSSLDCLVAARGSAIHQNHCHINFLMPLLQDHRQKLSDALVLMYYLFSP
ncbi:unnamed protein product [Urochloa humidicola]